MVQQDYIPTDVDEAEFEARISAPEGTSITAMEGMIEAVEPKVREVPGVVHVLSTVSGSSPRGTSQASMYVRLDDHRRARFFVRPIVPRTLRRRPAGGVSRQLQPARQNARGPLDHRVVSRAPGFGSQSHLVPPRCAGRSRFRRHRARSAGTGQVHRHAARPASRRNSRAWSTSTARCGWTSRICWPISTANGPPPWASTFSEIADTLRIAVGGDDRVSRYYDSQADDAYDVELRLRRRRPRRPARHFAALRSHRQPARGERRQSDRRRRRNRR